MNRCLRGRSTDAQEMSGVVAWSCSSVLRPGRTCRARLCPRCSSSPWTQISRGHRDDRGREDRRRPQFLDLGPDAEAIVRYRLRRFRDAATHNVILTRLAEVMCSTTVTSSSDEAVQ